MARFEKTNRSGRGFLSHLLQRSDVVQDVKPAPVGRDHQIVELLLHRHPGDGRVRQAFGESGPVASVIERIQQPVPGAREEQAFLVGILGDRAHVGELVLRHAVADLGPGLAEIRGFVDKGIAVVVQVEVHRHVGRAGCESGGRDAGDAAPGGQPRDVFAQIGPMLATVASDPNQTIVRAGPDSPFL